MLSIRVRNVHEALPEGLHQLRTFGVQRESRNGPVLSLQQPFSTEYTHPTEKVLFWQARDANPFFHFFEVLWMLAGREDVGFLKQFNSKIGNYSDDGKTFNAAYGYRWRKWFRTDQLTAIAQALAKNPDCRRQVLAIWDGHRDLGLDSKDLPCNTAAYFQRDAEGRLNMMVTNRSNDAVWGCYGANAVQFGALLEYMAAAIGCPVGTYHQLTMNLHLYLTEDHKRIMEAMEPYVRQPNKMDMLNPYEGLNPVSNFPMVEDLEDWENDLKVFMRASDENKVLSEHAYAEPFFKNVVNPLYQAWVNFKSMHNDRFFCARNAVSTCKATDWSMACREWLERREQKWLTKSA